MKTSLIATISTSKVIFPKTFVVVGVVMASMLCWGRSPAHASFQSRGEVAFEGRVFTADDDPGTQDYNAGLFTRLEARNSHHFIKEKIRLYGRLDAEDDARTLLVIEEAWVQAKVKPFELRLGIDLLNWSATEAFHPADVFNSRNLDSDFERYEKVGEPMAALSSTIPGGSVTLIYMPLFVAPKLPSPHSRTAFAGVDPITGDRLVISQTLALDVHGNRLGADHVANQGALRLRQSFLGADVELHLVHHVDRQQPEVGLLPSSATPVLIYRTVTQLGATYQQACGALLVKVEGAYRWFTPNRRNGPWGPLLPRDHGQLALGLEYGLPHSSGAESSLIAEGQGIVGVGDARAAALSIFQRDVLLGYRLAFNDVQSRAVFASVIMDVQRPEEIFAAVSYSQRLGETWQLSLAARFFHAPPRRGGQPFGLQLLDKADHLRIILSRYF